MPERSSMFARQAAWQRARAKLSWTEKLRLAVTLRAAASALRRPPPRNAPASAVAESRATYGGKKQ